MLMRFWWSWRVLPPRPIGNNSDDYRLIPFKNFFSNSSVNEQNKLWLQP